MKILNNPFKYGCIVSGNDLCPRPKLTKQIRDHIKSSQNIVLLGERRVGKSSMVNEAVDGLKNYKPLLIDFLGIKSIDALCRRILKSIVIYNQRRNVFQKIFQSLSAIRPTISVDPLTSMPTVSFDASIDLQADSISEAINLIKESNSSRSKIVVVFDEFQDILNISDPNEALSILRSNIQYQSDIPYIFVGSIRHKMDNIFNSQDAPFFKSAIPITVDTIPFNDFSLFILNKFSIGKRTVDEKLLQKVFKIANNIPGDVQQLCGALWEVTQEGKTIHISTLKEALNLIFNREESAYENYLRLLTDIQYKSLIAIARQGGGNIYSIQFMKSAGFNNASSLKKAIVRMINLNILFEYKDEIRFVNPFFRVWLLLKLG